MPVQIPRPLFAPGRIIYAAEMQQALRQANLHGISLIIRHLGGDWGEISDKRRQVNAWAITHPFAHNKPVISNYPLPDGARVRITTHHLHFAGQRHTTLAVIRESDSIPKPVQQKKKRSHKNVKQKPQEKNMQVEPVKTRRRRGGDPNHHPVVPTGQSAGRSKTT